MRRLLVETGLVIDGISTKFRPFSPARVPRMDEFLARKPTEATPISQRADGAGNRGSPVVVP